MEIHHQKHHAAYVANLNNSLAAYAEVGGGEERGQWGEEWPTRGMAPAMTPSSWSFKAGEGLHQVGPPLVGRDAVP